MYRACLFCHAALGGNERIERLPVGRRLAFDGAKGRLWVVCGRCRRWNLTPLEERWEAIEECERLYRDTRRRVSTDQIGLARLSDGLDLVRIGRPQRPEFAAWRYGEQLTRRRRRANWVTGAIGVGGAAALAADAALGGTITGMVGLLGWAHERIVHGPRDALVARLTGPRGEALTVRRKHLRYLALRGSAATGWALGVPHQRHLLGLTGADALHAAARLLPRLNAAGGRASTVADAVGFLERDPDPLRVFARVARNPTTGYILKLPDHVRLALEMAAQEDAERRALDGELAALELAWREAEEIAGIADDLLLPASVHQAWRRLRGATG